MSLIHKGYYPAFQHSTTNLPVSTTCSKVRSWAVEDRFHPVQLLDIRGLHNPRSNGKSESHFEVSRDDTEMKYSPENFGVRGSKFSLSHLCLQCIEPGTRSADQQYSGKMIPHCAPF